jgi:NADH:ubiquinone oxidoreductase subunit 6 (subunit J)
MLNILTLILYSLAFGLAITTNSFILIFLLISIFFLIFILFLVFNVNFLALSFLIVYIGAIAILFLFAVMLLGQQTTKKDTFSISLKLFLFTLFSTVLALFFMRIFPY